MPEDSPPPNPLDPSRATVRKALFGGQGSVRVWDLGAAVPPFTAVLFCELEPGARVGEHVQARDHEVVVVIAGHATVRVDGRTRACTAGSAVALPLGSRLAIDNTSMTEPARYLIVKARAGPST